jgi:hypothetical protein
MITPSLDARAHTTHLILYLLPPLPPLPPALSFSLSPSHALTYKHVNTGIRIISGTLGKFLPNIAFLRLLRFLKPLGRVRALFDSKVVVKV